MICDRCYQPTETGEHGQYLCPLEPRRVGFGVIDDQIEGGPRVFECFGHDGVFIESKSQWRDEVRKRPDLVHTGDKHDRAYYNRVFRQHDEQLRDTGQK